MLNVKTKMSKIWKKIIVLSFLLFLMAVAAKSAWAQSINFSPQNATKTIGESFTVDLNISTGGKEIRSADADINYDPEMFEVTSVVEKGGSAYFFEDGAFNIDIPGKILIVGIYNGLISRSTDGLFAKITLKGKKAGTGTLSFVCSAQKSDTNLLDGNRNDIIKCADCVSGSYVISSGSVTNPTPTPTNSPEPTSVPGSPTSVPTTSPTPTPPVSGISLPTIFSLGLGAVLTIIGLAVIF